MPKEIAVLDFGSQYTHLITRRIRELGVVSHIYPTDTPAEQLKNSVGIILSGGPRSLVRDARLPVDEKISTLNIPILGLCYGHQLIADIFGGQVKRGEAREYGEANITIAGASPIFKSVPKKTQVWMSHGDHVEILPPDFEQIASSGNRSVTAMANENKKIYGFQFHPEVAHTLKGKIILSNFLFEICRAEKSWTDDKMLKSLEGQIRREARGKKVFQLISGGVDSAVCYALLQKVLGPSRVFGLYVDNGFMRLNETTKIEKAFSQAGFKNIRTVLSGDEFMANLKGITEPEEKRKIIGNTFLNIVDRIMEAEKFSPEDWLVGQGTIYPDTIESGGTKNADVIKTHHNRVARIKQMIVEGKIIEPIKELYKDEVRAMGLKLGLPKKFINRHPFPGPGLAIRCLCSAKKSGVTKLINLKNEKIKIVKLPVQSVGVEGDERSYKHPGVIMSEKLLPWSRYKKLSPRITNERHDLNRTLVLVDGDAKKLPQSSCNKKYLTSERIALLRQIDDLVQTITLKDKNYQKIWQFPVVLIPFGYKNYESVVLRPVTSAEAMTVSFAEISPKTIAKITKAISKLGAVDFIFYDTTNKPPGTIEWE